MKDLIDYIKENCTPIDREARFDQMLDEAYDFSNVGGPFAHMVPSQVLKEMDPTAYRCGVNDYVDGEDTYEIDGDTYDQKEVDDARDQFVDALNEEAESLQEELTEICADEDQVITAEFEARHENLCKSLRDALKRWSQAKSYEF